MGRGDQSTELTREELYAQVWAEPMTILARRYTCTASRRQNDPSQQAA